MGRYTSRFIQQSAPDDPAESRPLTLSERIRRLVQSGKSGAAAAASSLLATERSAAKYNPFRRNQMALLERAGEAFDSVEGPESRGKFSERLKSEPFQAVAEGIAQTGPTAAAVLGTTAINPIAGTVLGAELAFGDAYESAKDQGAGEGRSLLTAAGVAAGSGALERVGAGSILKGKGGFLGRLATGTVGEGATETAQEALSIGGDLAAGGSLDVDDAKERLLQGGVLGAATGGLGGGLIRQQKEGASVVDTLGARPQPVDPYYQYRPGRSKTKQTLDRIGNAFDSRGGMPEPIAEARERADQVIAAENLEASLLRDKLVTLRGDYLKNHPDVNEQQLVEATGDYLTGESGAQVPNELRPALDEMREITDRNSQALADTPGLLTEEQKAIFEGQLGSYQRRSYRRFTDPDWQEKVRDTPVWEAARQHLAKEHPDLTPEGMEGLLETLTASTQPESGQSAGGPLGTLDLSVLKGRKEIDAPILELMGIHRDPAHTFIDGASRAVRTIHRHEMYQAMADGGLGNVFFKAPVGGYSTPIAGPDSRQPLGGMFTSKTLAQAFDKGFEENHKPMGHEIINGIVKEGLVVHSPQAQMRNAESNMLSLMANGNLSFGTARNLKKGAGAAAVAARFSGKTDGELADLAVTAKRLGVTGGSVHLGDIQSFLGDVDPELRAKGKGSLSRYRSVAKRSYQAGDDIFKIAGFLAERDKYKHALGDTATDAEIDTLAANIVKDTMQNYDRLVPAIKMLRKAPLVGTFPSFPSEVIRNAKNIMNLSFREMGDKNPAVRLIGARRLGGFAAANAVPSTTKLAVLTGAAATGAAMEWDDETEEAVRWFSAPWIRDSEMIPVSAKGDGRVQFVDSGFVDFWATVKKPVIASMRAGEVDEEAFDRSAKQLASQFVNYEIVAQAVGEVFRGETESGREIYSEKDSVPSVVYSSAKHMLESWLPGGLKIASRIYKAAKEGDTAKLAAEGGALFGPRVVTTDAERSLPFRVREWKDNHWKSSKIAAIGAQDELEGARQDELISYRDLGRSYKHAVKLGMEPRAVEFEMRVKQQIAADDMEIAKAFAEDRPEDFATLIEARRAGRIERYQKEYDRLMKKFRLAFPDATRAEIEAEQEKLRRRFLAPS